MEEGQSRFIGGSTHYSSHGVYSGCGGPWNVHGASRGSKGFHRRPRGFIGVPGPLIRMFPGVVVLTHLQVFGCMKFCRALMGAYDDCIFWH